VKIVQAFVNLWVVDSERFFNVESLICRYLLLKVVMKNLHLFWDLGFWISLM